jgi:hypothetical protein
MTQPAVTVPAGPTSCARRRLAREGSAYPARRGVHTLHTVSLFRPSPKVAMNPIITDIEQVLREKKPFILRCMLDGIKKLQGRIVKWNRFALSVSITWA